MKIKSISQHIKDNKYKIFLFLIGYILFVTSKEQLSGFETMFFVFSPLTFFIVYSGAILLMYLFIKTTIPLYNSLKIKNNFDFKTFFYLISIGSGLGLLTNILQALIKVTFIKYIGI